MIDTDLSQPWFVHLTWEDPYHGTLGVMTGSLREVVYKLRYLVNETSIVAKIYHPTPNSTINVSSDWVWKAIESTAGLLQLKEVAHLVRDDDFASSKRSLLRAIQNLPTEQKQVELASLISRASQELEALKVQKEVNEVKV